MRQRYATTLTPEDKAEIGMRRLGIPDEDSIEKVQQPSNDELKAKLYDCGIDHWIKTEFNKSFKSFFRNNEIRTLIVRGKSKNCPQTRYYQIYWLPLKYSSLLNPKEHIQDNKNTVGIIRKIHSDKQLREQL